MQYTTLSHRAVLRLDGVDRLSFLQGLITNDITLLTPKAALYACLLTPQGKFLHDFYLVMEGDSILLTPEASRAADLLQRLQKYILRSKVVLSFAPTHSVYAVFANDSLPTGIFPNPQHAGLGGIVVSDHPPSGEMVDAAVYDRLRITLGIPDGSRDMMPEHALLLEHNVDAAHGISWQKGCYMGQELTARTKYRGLLKRCLTPLQLIAGTMPEAGTTLYVDTEEAGELRSSRGDVALGLIRREFLEKAETVFTSDTAQLKAFAPA